MPCWPFWRPRRVAGLRIIAGLGNPGPRYAKTRHNMGFWVTDMLSRELDIPLSRRGFDGMYGQGEWAGQKVLLLQPMTYMNDSGRCVAKAVRYFGVQPGDVLLIYDDIDLPPGRVRVRAQGGPGTHNGMRSVVQALGTEAFPRIRVGIGPPPSRERLIEWVLGTPSEEERAILAPAVSQAALAARLWLQKGVEAAMAQVNPSP